MAKKIQKIGGKVNNYAGQFFSLNMKNANYFGIGGDREQPKFWLSPENYVDQVPEGLSDEEAALIDSALETGRIVEGKQFIPTVDKNKAVLTQYVDLLAEFRTTEEKFKLIMQNLLRHGKDGNYTAHEIAREMLKKEEGSMKRAPFVTYLKQFIEHCTGPVSLVKDSAHDTDKYTVSIDGSGKINELTPRPKREKTLEEQMQEQGSPKDDPATRSSIINQVL